MDEPARKRAAVETYARNETTLRRTASRYSLCADDVDDALQRSLEILLRKAPTDDPQQLIKWMQTVVKREALAIRRERERILVAPGSSGTASAKNWVDHLPADADGPAERVERREAIARSREALQELKPQELRALTLLAEGYTYAEIGEITGYSQTKINRCLAEGRERFRRLVARSEEGRRCAELKPLLSRFCDSEAGTEEVAKVREHLRVCAHCRATLRAYREAPAAAAALAPTLPLDRSLWERVHDSLADLSARFGGGAGEPTTQLAGGAGGLGGATAAAKLAAICLGAAGGAVACVAGGVVPAPFDASPDRERPRLERRLVDLSPPAGPTPVVAYEPAPAEGRTAPRPERRAERDPSPARRAAPVGSEPLEPVEPAAASSDAVESAPAPAPVAEPPPTSGGGDGGSAAGEFGP